MVHPPEASRVCGQGDFSLCFSRETPPVSLLDGHDGLQWGFFRNFAAKITEHKNMDLYVFNPEHDIVLASGGDRLTPPRAARQLRHDLGFLPALWAGEGDVVLVDDAAYARQAFAALGREQRCTFAERRSLRPLLSGVAPADLHLRPWGWDRQVARELCEAGVPGGLLPDEARLRAIRTMSHRRWAAEHLLAPLRQEPGTVGESRAATSVEACVSLVATCGEAMVKAPWSSSGRGVRRVTPAEMTPSLRGWLARMVAEQGCVMVEPYYKKVSDFGVELMSDGQGVVRLCGLSLFYTEHGAYVGNLVMGEEEKWQLLSALVSRDGLVRIVGRLCDILGEALRGVYAGPLGIDMMVVDIGGDLRLHPCVEMNLRATMGHVALRV